MRKYWPVLLSIVLMVASAGVFKTLLDAGAFDRVWDHPLPHCQVLPGLVGTEDLVQIPGTQKVIISANDRAHIKPWSANGLYLYDLEQASRAPVLLSGSTGLAWHPQGLSVWKEGEGEGQLIRVFAINHSDGSDKVEVMDLRGDALIPVRSIEFPGIRTLNALVAIDSSSFYVSQDLGAQTSYGQLLEKYLRLPHGKVWLHRDGKTEVSAEGITFPNGLALSPDQKYLYVASMLDRSLLVFERDPARLALTLKNSIFLDTAPDNLKWAPDQRLLIGSQLHLLDLAAFAEDPLSHRSPSQVIAVGGLPDAAVIEEIYSSTGEMFSGVSTGLQVGKYWLMGTGFGEGLLVCGSAED